MYKKIYANRVNIYKVNTKKVKCIDRNAVWWYYSTYKYETGFKKGFTTDNVDILHKKEV